jgi:hypothetical protein
MGLLNYKHVTDQLIGTLIVKHIQTSLCVPRRLTEPNTCLHKILNYHLPAPQITVKQNQLKHNIIIYLINFNP